MKPLGQGRRLVKNGLSGILGSGVGGLIQFATLFMIIRALPVEDFGHFSNLLSFGLIVQYIADFGLSSVLVKELSARPTEELALRGKAQGLVWLISGVLLVGSSVTIFCLYPTWVLRGQALLMTFMGVAFFQCAGYTAVVRAREDMEWNACGHVVHKLVLMGGVVLSIHLAGGVWGIAGAHALAGLVLLFFYVAVVCRRYGLVSATWDPSYWVHLFRRSLPLGSGLFVRQFAWQVDIFLLTALTTPYIVGLFSAPYRIFAACLLLAQVLAIPIFPMLSRLSAAGDRAGFERVYQRSIKFLLLFGVPAAALGWCFSSLIVNRMLGSAYAETTDVFRLLSLIFPLIFAGALFPFVFAALDRQLTFVLISLVGLALRVGVAAALVPTVGFIGACYGVLISETVVIGLWMEALRRQGLRVEVGRLIIGVIGGLVAMIGVMQLAGVGQSWLQSCGGIAAASGVLLAWLWWGRILDADERDGIRKIMQRVLRRGRKPEPGALQP